MRPSVRATEVMTEIRRRGSVSLSVLVSQFAGRDEQDIAAVVHALARARLVEISSEPHGDIVTLTNDGVAALHQEARRRG